MCVWRREAFAQYMESLGSRLGIRRGGATTNRVHIRSEKFGVDPGVRCGGHGCRLAAFGFRADGCHERHLDAQGAPRGERVIRCRRLGRVTAHRGQGESLVPAYTRGSVSLSWGPRGSVSVSLMGARAKAWCPLIHAEPSISLMGGKVIAWCLLIQATASLSLSWGPR